MEGVVIVIAALVAAYSGGRLVAGLLGLRGREPRSRPARSRAGPRLRPRLQGWLNRAGLGLSVERFVVATVGLAATSGLAVWALTWSPGLGVVAAAVAGGGPAAAHDRRARARSAVRLEAWPDALRDLATNLRAPMSLHDALIELATSGPEPLRPVFTPYRTNATTLDPRAALEMIREELADPVSDRIIEILLVAFEQGSSVVVDILVDLAESTGADLRLLADVETAQLETRVEARLAALLPFAVLALLIARSPEYRSFYATGFGTAIIVAGAGLVLVGLHIIARLGRSLGEERVLAAGMRP